METPPKRSALEVVRKCWSLLDPRLRRNWILQIPLALFAAGLEAIGAGLIFLLIKMISGGADLTTVPLLGRYFQPGDSDLLLFGAGVVAFYCFKNAFLLFQTTVAFRSAAHTVVIVGGRVLRGYLGAPYSLHLARSSADLIRNVQQAVDGAFRMVLVSAVQLASETVIALSLIAVMLFAAPLVTLVTAALAALLIGVLLKVTQARLRYLGKRAHDLYTGLFGTLQQSLAGVKELKVLGRERFFADQHDLLRRAMARIQWRRGTIESAPRLFIETAFVMAVVGVIALARIFGQGDEIVAVLGLFGYAGLRILPSVNRSIWYLNQMHFASPQVDALVKDWNQVVRPQLGEKFEVTFASDDRGPPLSLQRSIELENVSLTYAGADRPALDSITMSIRRGETVAIVGSTGAGKSTLLDLILGLHEPSSGRVLVDGEDLRSRLGAYRRSIGYVPQTIFLTDDTLRRNIALGIADKDVDEERIKEAVASSQLTRFVAALPAGLETKVGERGVRLSGGERQRIAVARALYHRPEILVFDEATSALDNETEAALQQAIEALGKERTIIIVAHRLATVERADRLVFLEGGRLADSGRFEELLARNENFRRMAQANSE